MPNPLTVSQAAAELKLSTQRVRKIIAAGLLKATAINSRLYLISPRDLAAYEKQRPVRRIPKK